MSDDDAPLSPEAWKELRERLARSRFRSRFRLDDRDPACAADRGIQTLRNHARDFVTQRLAPGEPKNDGRQTPMRGHPVFVAQHATATCCRECLRKWHGIPPGRRLDDSEIAYVVAVISAWLGGCATRTTERPAPEDGRTGLNAAALDEGGTPNVKRPRSRGRSTEQKLQNLLHE